MSLDELYGRSDPPSGDISQAELNFTPRSLTRLDAESARVLADIMAITQRNPLARASFSNLPILWVMPASGEIFFAMEEIIDNASGDFYHCLPKGRLTLLEGRVKLGHPSLLPREDKTARIGGEIIYDPDPARGPDWAITNSSGRYGRRAGQTVEHLTAAAGKFTTLGLHLRVEFDG